MDLLTELSRQKYQHTVQKQDKQNMDLDTQQSKLKYHDNCTGIVIEHRTFLDTSKQRWGGASPRTLQHLAKYCMERRPCPPSW